MTEADVAEVTSSAVAFDRVTKRFGHTDGSDVLAIDDVSFDVPVGRIVALLGPSGSGKTTLLNIAAGLILPDEGRLQIGGRDAGSDWSRVGYVFQDDRLLPWRTAATNVALALEAGPMPAAARRIRSKAMLELVELGEFAGSFPHELSGGMRSRVALARSLAPEPEILLMDEPFARLDAQTRAAMHTQLLDIHSAQRVAILFVTHDVEEAVVLADEIIVLSPRPGRIHRKVAVPLARPRLGTPAAVSLANDLRRDMANVALTK